MKKDPSLSLYAVPGGSIKGRVVAILLNDKTRASDVLGIMQALKTRACMPNCSIPAWVK